MVLNTLEEEKQSTEIKTRRREQSTEIKKKWPMVQKNRCLIYSTSWPLAIEIIITKNIVSHNFSFAGDRSKAMSFISFLLVFYCSYFDEILFCVDITKTRHPCKPQFYHIKDGFKGFRIIGVFSWWHLRGVDWEREGERERERERERDVDFSLMSSRHLYHWSPCTHPNSFAVDCCKEVFCCISSSFLFFFFFFFFFFRFVFDEILCCVDI